MGSSTGSLLVPDDETLEAVLRSGNPAGRHPFRGRGSACASACIWPSESGDVATHPVWRDVETAVRATRRVLKLARETGRRVHVLHVTTAEEMALLAEAKDIATVEATPQHLTLVAPDCYRELGTLAQMNPPIREARHRDGLWQAVRDGVVDCIGSDHAPHTLEEKAKPYPTSPSGMAGVQTLLPLLLDHMAAGRLTLERIVDLTSAGPQRIYDIAGKGRIAVGYDADLVLVDLETRRVIRNEWIASRCGWTPFDGREVKGWPKATILRGHVRDARGRADRRTHRTAGAVCRMPELRGDEVMSGCIVGWAHTPFGKHEGKDVEALMLQVIDAALADAGVDAADIDRIYVGHFNAGFSKQDFPSSLASRPRPNSASSRQRGWRMPAPPGSAAIHAGLTSLAAKQARLVLAVGVEKMTDTPGGRGGRQSAEGELSEGRGGRGGRLRRHLRAHRPAIFPALWRQVGCAGADCRQEPSQRRRQSLCAAAQGSGLSSSAAPSPTRTRWWHRRCGAPIAAWSPTGPRPWCWRISTRRWR